MIGILFESNEWSDHKLAAELEKRGLPVVLINLEEPGNEDRIFSCDMLVSRIFASSVFRGHDYALSRMPELLRQIDELGIPIINPSLAHSFEISKFASTTRLGQEGFSVPAIYACDYPKWLSVLDFSYPCIIKPDCGGRANFTAIVHSPAEAQGFLDLAPDFKFIVEEYIEPEKGYLTRVEVIGPACAFLLKRFVTESGLASFQHGSTYARYDNPSEALLKDCVDAARTLSFEVGSFDVIERGDDHYFIDANSVSNSNKGNPERIGFDLMSAYADHIASL